MVEAPVRAAAGGSGSSRVGAFGTTERQRPVRLQDVDARADERISLCNGEVDRLLGGGIVPGSLVLIGGEPGIGKSTLSLQIPLHCPSLRTLYVTGEESARQVKMRANRLGGEPQHCSIYAETLLENILEEAKQMSPDLMIVDSVQTMYTEAMDSAAGSVSQIKEVAARLLRYAKESGVPVILIGHITKDGFIAGPKILEHIVDVVLQFEGDNRGAYRILRSIKNRFGSTSEIAVFEMTGSGLREVSNPSEMLIPMHEQGLSGTAVAAMLDGTRPFLFEVQALVSSAAYGTAQTVFGIYFKLQSFVFMPVFGLNNGMVPILAYNFGARKRKRMVQTVKLSMLYAFLFLLVGFLLFELMPEKLLRIFDTGDPSLITLGVPALKIIGFHYLAAWFCIISGTVFQALGNGIYTTITSLCRQMLVLLPVAYLLSMTGDVDKVWLSFLVAEIASAAATFYFFRRIYREKIQPMFDAQ